MVKGKRLFIFLLIISLPIFILLVLVNKTSEKQKSISESLKQEQKVTRKAVVSGSFYPADSYELNDKISNLLNQSTVIPGKGKLRILIVPHAGIEFSGRVAGAGFKQIEGKDYKRVILIGASHRQYLDHAAVDTEDEWETPLGKVSIDKDLANVIIEQNNKIISDSTPHTQEHSLEIELIFLQKILSDFKIVPILLGQPTEETINILAQKISQNIDDETLIIISTDLSHYPAWDLANKVDNQTIDAILTGKKENLEKEIKIIESKKYPSLETAACGYQPLRVALEIANILKLPDFRKIKYENSGDVTSDKAKVVGYAAIGVWGENIESLTEKLDGQAQKEALEIASKTLNEYISNKKMTTVEAKNQILTKPFGAFVTLKKHGKLRGCIGSFEPSESLARVIQNMTIAAATQDSRFLPVEPNELRDITIEISVMTPKRKIGNWKDIKLGKHGVVVQKDNRSGTFLPQVATETGWSKEQFLSELCSQKASLPADCYKDPEVTLHVFEAQVFGEKE